ncbi:MAG: hypothetical protein L0Y66_14115 [Myxococcaceae bacterium]|nr:hypothetical protein [Myxococcaceae bacterium]MCI0674014.1 hypothetical protein [Myxococcaceae bacterium]
MRPPPLAWPSGLLALSLLLLTSPASAQDAAVERGAVRLRAGVASHQALQVEGGEAHPYRGWTADNLGLSAHLFGNGPLGGAVELEREVVRLLPTGGAGEAHLHSLLRGTLALAARGDVGPLKLLARVGYGFAQLPFGMPTGGLAPTGLQHAVVVAPRARLALPWWALQLEAAGELWLPLRATDAQRRPLEVKSGAVSLALGRRMGTVGPFGWSLWLDAQGARTDAARTVGSAAFARVGRVGLSTELTWDALPSSTP